MSRPWLSRGCCALGVEGIGSANNEMHKTDYTNNIISVTQVFERYSALKIGQI
jgi:hypothetical protein